MSDLLQVQFQTLEEGADPKRLPPGTLLRADNCAMDKARRLVKRPGTTYLVRTILYGGSVSAGERLTSRGDVPAMFDGEHALAYSADLSAWKKVGRPPRLRITSRGLVDSTRSTSCADTALYGNLLVTFFQSGYSATGGARLYVQVENVDTGAKVLLPELVSTNGANPRVLVNGTRAYLVWSEDTGKIVVAVLDLSVMLFEEITVGVTTTIATDARAGIPSVVDACLATASDGLRLYVAYSLSAGVDRGGLLSVLAADLSSLDTATYTITASSVRSVGVCSDGTSLFVVAASNAAPRTTILQAYDLDLNTTVAATQIYAGTSSHVFIAEHDETQLLVGWARCDFADAGTDAYRLTTALYSKAAFAQDAATQRVSFPVLAPSKPWRVGSRWYCAAVALPRPYSYTSTDPIPTASSVVLEIEAASSVTGTANSPHVHQGTLENQTAWYATQAGYVPQASVRGDEVFVPAAYRNVEPTGIAQLTTIPIGWSLHKVEVGGGDAHRIASLGRSALCAAGAPYWWDGSTAMPYGFVHAPIIVSVTPTAGGSMAAGTYSYVAVYEWRDANGVKHRSPPSPAVTGAASGGNLSMSIKVACTSLSNHTPYSVTYGGAFGGVASPVIIALYRTKVGPGTEWYRLTREPEYQVLVNDPTVGDVTLVDTRADDDITGSTPDVPLATQEQLYTSTGQLDDVPPPSFVTATTHQGRLVGVDGTLRRVWFSKDASEDATVAPGFNEALTLAFSDDKTALASLDDKLLAFSADGLDAVYGKGPDASGAGTWDVQRVQTDVGCVNPRSVCPTPMGVVFESSRGIELVSRDLSVSWIGKQVEDTLAAYPTVTSAVLVEDAHEIRLTCNKADGSSGVVLAWDYLHKFWFARTYNDAAYSAVDGVAFVDAALIDGVYTLMTASGQVYQETTAHKLDAGTTWVVRDVRLAPMSPAGSPVSWSRVKDVTIVGTSVTDHQLEVSVARDYATAFEQTKTFPANSLTTDVGPANKCRVTLKNQKCQAVEVRVRDLAPDPPDYGTGDGPILEGVAFRVGVKQGPPKTAAGEQG